MNKKTTKMLDKTEDEYDLQAYESAMNRYKTDPRTYTLDELELELGLKNCVDL